MSIGAAGAGASASIKEILRDRFLAQQEAARVAQAQAELQLAQAREANDQQFRTGQLERQGRLDAGAAAQQTRENELADTTRRETGNVRGVQRMIGELIQREGITPTNRKQIVGMLSEIGKLPSDELLNDPEAARAAELVDYEAKKKLDAKYRPPTQGSTEQAWVKRGGTVIPIPKGTAQAGDEPYDPVAARSAQPANNAEAVDTARETARLASALRTHPGFGGAFGKWSALNPTLTSSQDAINARTLLKSLQGLLTIENMGKMKGVLSDADMRILRQASTTLAEEMSEPAAAAELDRLVEVMSKVTANGGATGMPDDPNDALLDELLGGV